MRFDEAVRRLERWPHPLPGPPAALQPFAIVDGSPVQVERAGETRDAAVLVVVFPGPDDEAWTVLMERPAGDLRHAGEISFPGGAVEPDDASIAAAAIREAREEVGIDAEQCGLRVVGELEPVEVRVSGFRLHPVVAIADRRPFLEGDAREVSAVLEVPMAAFLADAPIETFEEQRAGWRLRYGAYPVAGYRVWGATARVLGQLGAVLSDEPGAVAGP